MEYFDQDVFYAMGITDIDDKIIKRAIESGKSWKDIALHYEADFKEDMQALNVAEPNAYLNVSAHIPDVVAYIQGILENGYAYQSKGSVYYSVEKLGDRYGLLGRNRAGVSINHDGDLGNDHGKLNTKDFALWKVTPSDSKVDPRQISPPSWTSPWGQGRPGWHIECSAMVHSCFGRHLDIHSGGIDLLFPHHTNELAQWYVK